MEGLLTNYYEYHFLYIGGIHHVEIAEHPGHGPDEALLPPGHEHGPGDGRDDRLRHPVAGLHAAGDRLAVHHPVRRRERAGRLPRALQRDEERSARSRTRRSSRSGRCSPACPASRPRRRSAAASGPSSSASTPTGSAPTRCRPTRSSRPSTSGNAISPSGNVRIGDEMPIVPVNSLVKQVDDLKTIPIRPGVSPTVYLRDVATVQDASDIHDRLRPGQRPPGRLHPRDQAGRRLDALGRQERQGRPARDAGGPPRRHQGQLRVRPVADRHPRDDEPGDRRGPGGRPDRADGAASSSATGGASSSSS